MSNLAVTQSGKLMIHDILVRMGVFRALYASAVQFNSVLFRLIVGVLAVSYGVPVDTVAVVTAVEFTLNCVLDVPCGYVADRIGRIPASIAGLVLIMCGLVCIYLALITHNEFSRYLFIAHGVLIGIAKPLQSGSVEAFYQDAIKQRCSTGADDQLADTSLTVSHNHGKYYTTIAVIASFVLAWIFNAKHILPHAFAVGILAYAGCILTLLKDYRELGDIDRSLESSAPNHLLGILFLNARARASLIYNLFFWLMTVVMAGYLILSLGREWSASTTIQWTLMASFMLGYSAFGWVFKGMVLPRLIQSYSQRSYLILLSAVTIAMSIGFYLLYGATPIALQASYLFVYGIVFHTATSAIQNVSMNQLMTQIKKQDFATALSFQNIPGYFAVGIYSLYLKEFRAGSPSVREAFLSVAIISIVFLGYVLFAEPDSKKKDLG